MSQHYLAEGVLARFAFLSVAGGAPQDQQYSAAATASSSTFVYRGHCAFVLAVAVSAEIDSKVGCKGGAGNRHCNVSACDRNFCVVPAMVIGMCFEFANKQISISINRRPPGNCLEKSLRIGAHTHAHARKHIHTYANIRKHTQTRTQADTHAHACCGTKGCVLEHTLVVGGSRVHAVRTRSRRESQPLPPTCLDNRLSGTQGACSCRCFQLQAPPPAATLKCCQHRSRTAALNTPPTLQSRQSGTILQTKTTRCRR